MKVALITIGNELLSGMTVDTNAAWIGRELHSIGLQVVTHITIPDDHDRIVSALNNQSKNHDVVITTGGLGPTHDDITPKAIFDYFDTSVSFDEKYWTYLKQRFKRAGIDIPDINRNQAFLPDKGKVIPNPVGSARGLHFQEDDVHFFSTPGVPAEMKGMMKETILPFLSDRSGADIHSIIIRTTGMPESGLAEKLDPIIHEHQDCVFAFYPNYLEVNIRITSENRSCIEAASKDIKSSLGNMVFGSENDTLESTVGSLLKEKNLTIATAESCTGGLIGHRLTDVPGSSDYYLGGIVSYSNVAKMDLLKVSSSVLDSDGAVSESTARQMAEGVQQRFGADIGISVTGIAGPGGGTEEKPIGTVYFGLAIGEKTIVKHKVFGKNRKRNKLRSSQFALNMIRLALDE